MNVDDGVSVGAVLLVALGVAGVALLGVGVAHAVLGRRASRSSSAQASPSS